MTSLLNQFSSVLLPHDIRLIVSKDLYHFILEIILILHVKSKVNFYFTGPGTYNLHSYIYSSLAGVLKLVPKSKASTTKSEADVDKEDTSVEVHAPGKETIVPAVGDVVTCKVLAVNPRYISAVNPFLVSLIFVVYSF